MTYTCDQIKLLANPLKELGSASALVEHRDVLDELSVQDKIALATRMIGACPKEKMLQLTAEVDAISPTTQYHPDSFHFILDQAIKVKQVILALLDSENPKPHSMIKSGVFEPGLFARFTDLTKRTLTGNEVAIAEKLALCTPEEDRSSVARTIAIVFPLSVFAAKIEAAFALRRSIEMELCGEKPQQFFTSRDFNIELCKEFSTLCHALLSGHEKNIGEQLRATIDTVTTSTNIKRRLNSLGADTNEPTNPFKLIAAVMFAEDRTQQNGFVFVNPNTLFGPTSGGPASPIPRGTQKQQARPDSDEPLIPIWAVLH